MAGFTGIVEHIVYRNDETGFTVAAVKLDDGAGRISAVGTLPFLAEGEYVTMEGTLGEHREYGRQLRVTSYTASRPATPGAVERYLASGFIKGIGAKTAALIVKHFGEATLDILAAEPERLAEVAGIGRKRALMIAESYAEQNGMRTTLMFLQENGLSPALSAKVYKAYGEMTETVLRRTPYRLADEIDGVGFRTADEIARRLGFTPECPERLAGGVRFVLDEAANGEGHMYLPEDELCRRAGALLGAEPQQMTAVVRALEQRHSVEIDRIGDINAVYLPTLRRAERDTAELLKSLRRAAGGRGTDREEILEGIRRFEAREGMELCEKQEEAVIAAVSDGVAVITGGPGTGKTTAIKCIIAMMEHLGRLELCAPTGRAAKRMSEATGRSARTIHRLLEYSGEEGGGFARNEEEPLEADVVIVDEMSMVDIFLMRALLRALKPGTRLVLVGDADQLPSVGAGNVLRDLIAAQVVRVVCLTEIFRQAQQSMIVMNAHRINHGEYPVLRTKDTDFFIDRKDSVRDTVQAVITLVKSRLPRYLGLPDERGIQVMTPMKRGESGVFAFNRALQEALNPDMPGKPQLTRGDTVFRVGDRIMQVKNDYELEWETDTSSGTGVFNGDIGYITSISRADGKLNVEFDDGRRVVYSADSLDELEPAYCMSVHKSQGSEFEAVVLPLLNGPDMLLTRNLLYTAVTRARRLVVIVGRESCVRRMVDNDRIALRYSALDVRLRGEL